VYEALKVSTPEVLKKVGKEFMKRLEVDCYVLDLIHHIDASN